MLKWKWVNVLFKNAWFWPGQKMKAKSSKSLYVTNMQSERIRRSTISGLDFGSTESRFAGAMAAIGREFWEFVGYV